MPSRYGPQPGCLQGTKSGTLWNGATETKLITADFSGFRYGESNPAYKRQIAMAEDATTPFHARQQRLLVTEPAFISATYNGKVSTGEFSSSPSIALYGFPDTTSLSTTEIIASTNFYQKAAQNFQSLPFLGELRETIRMIRRPALSLRRGLDHYLEDVRKRRLNIAAKAGRRGYSRDKALKDYREVASSTWLEYRFGWTPLVEDIEDILGLADQLMKAPQIEKVSGFGEQWHFGAVTRWPWDVQYVFGVSANIQRVYRTQVRYKAGIHAPMSVSTDLSNGVGVLPSDFVPAAWELLPYSWVLDYFGNIGEVLDAWATVQRLKLAYCTRTERHWCLDGVWNYPYLTDSAMKLQSWSPGRSIALRKEIKRTKVAQVPIPSMTLRTKLSTSRGLNLAALVHLRGEATRFRNRHRL